MPLWFARLRAVCLAGIVAAAATVFAISETTGPLFWAAVLVGLVAVAGYALVPGTAPHAAPGPDGTGGWTVPPRVHLVILVPALVIAGVGLTITTNPGTLFLYALALTLALVHVPTVLVGLAQVRAAHQAHQTRDQSDEGAGVAAVPRGGDAGWWDGLQAYGPGYAHGTVYARRDPGGWEHPAWPVPVCPDCRMDRGLCLLWLDGRPELGRLLCSCGAVWQHPQWCTADGAAWALAHEGPHLGQDRPGADVDPTMAYWAQMIRRQAGNTTHTADGT